jgi:hypothetical protein
MKKDNTQEIYLRTTSDRMVKLDANCVLPTAPAAMLTLLTAPLAIFGPVTAPAASSALATVPS